MPYSSDLNYGQHQGYPGGTRFSGRHASASAGIRWALARRSSAAVSGCFYDNPGSGMVDKFGSRHPPATVCSESGAVRQRGRASV